MRPAVAAAVSTRPVRVAAEIGRAGSVGRGEQQGSAVSHRPADGAAGLMRPRLRCHGRRGSPSRQVDHTGTASQSAVRDPCQLCRAAGDWSVRVADGGGSPVAVVTRPWRTASRSSSTSDEVGRAVVVDHRVGGSGPAGVRPPAGAWW